MLAYARSRSLPNAPIARTIIWIRSCKIYFSSAAAFAFFSQSRRCALGGSGFALGNLVERRRRSLVGRAASFPPAAGAGAACGGGGSGCAVAVLANSVPWLTRRLPVWTSENHNIIRSAFVTSRWLPQKPSNYSKRWHCRILHNALGRGSMLRLWLPEVTCCCQIHSTNKTSKSG